MITDKLMMPYLLASQHPIVHFALGIAGLIVRDSFHIRNSELNKDLNQRFEE